jgi:hypothetical protein
MIKQIPPHTMSNKERLDEVAEIMMRGVIRLKNCSGKSSFRRHLTGLQRDRKRSCKDEKTDKNTKKK